MKRYVLKRIVQIIFTMYIFATIVFFIVALKPGDISQVYIENQRIPPEAREALKQRLGLDQPLHIQYGNFLRNLIIGNLGISHSNYPRPVWDIIRERLPRTATLFLAATLIYFAMAYYLGKLIAWRRGGWLDYSATITGVTLWTIYSPWFGLLLIWIFGFKLGWLPLGKFLDPLLWRKYEVGANEVFHQMLLVGGGAVVFLLGVFLVGRRLRLPPRARLAFHLGAVALVLGGLGYLLTNTLYGLLARDILWHMVLPVVTLTLIGFGGYMLLMRDSMLEVVKEDFVLAAKAKGLPDKVVRDKHAARNALLPLVTSFALALAFVVDGGVIIERVFSWPGMGLTLLEAVDQKDLPLAIGTFVFTGLFAVLAHFLVDLLYAYLDPRIRYD